MSTVPVIESAAACRFGGEHAQVIEQLYKLIERLWKEHRTSPTRAGDELVYAFGNLDCVVVVNQDVLGALVEVKTKLGNVDCQANEQGDITATLNADPKEGGREDGDVATILNFTVRALDDYYYKRRVA
ncbi:MAG: hypothetical protein CFK52_10275 [Chloracidobacterium sp. CP2_5A]|nr:MAG: hypothetical protein CFK52_10275 [Chloracidobacterium sp. CP2_5A]